MDSKAYREKARELREAAALAHGEAVRKELLVMADQYELLAESANSQQPSPDSSSPGRSS